MEIQRIIIKQDNLKEEKVREFMISNIQAHYKATIITTEWRLVER